MFRLSNNSFYHYPDSAPGVGGSAPIIDPMSKDDIVDFLADEGDDNETINIDEDDKGKAKDKDKDKDKEKGKEKEDKDSKVDEDDEVDDEKDEDKDDDDELKSIEEDLEEPDEEKLELVTPVARREILKKYPQLFKEFPYLEKAYYREQQYTEILPTLDDAKEAVEAVKTLTSFEKDLTDGNTETILAATKKGNPKAFNKLVDNYLSVLNKVDTDSFHHVVGNVIKQTVMEMVSEGHRSKNEALGSAASLIYQFVFGTTDFKPPTNLSKVTDKDGDGEESELDKQKKEFAQQRFTVARDDLNNRVNNSIKNTIDANLDPKKSMTDWVRKTATRDALEEVNKLISKDGRFKVITDKLWERAFAANFSKPSVDAIRSAYFSKAKTLLPSVIKKARNDALKGMGRRVKNDDTEDNTTELKSGQRGGKTNNDEPQSRNRGKTKDIPAGMSTLEFLNSD